MIRNIKSYCKSYKSILIIVLAGLLARLIFTWFIAPSFFSREYIEIDNDTPIWMASLANLLLNGELSSNLSNEMASYGRMPGYSFFFLPPFGLATLIYNIKGFDSTNPEIWFLIIKITAYTQIVLDSISIFLIYYFSLKTIKQHSVAIISALLYAFYPFVIVWNPVCYAEIPSIFFALLALSIIVGSDKKIYWALAGFSMGFSILNKPQYAILVPLILLLIHSKYKDNSGTNLKHFLVFIVCFGLMYGSWPLRNYIRFNKVVFTQDIRAFSNWNVDVMAFMHYIYSVKSEWEPQFTNIIKNQKVSFPKEAYTNSQDSIKLEHAIALAKTCGAGFSQWNGYWKEPITPGDSMNDCSSEIAQIFNELREKQIKQFPFNYYVYVPLQNLKKAIFKTELVNKNNIMGKAVNLLFYYRSVLILLGLTGLVVMYKQKDIRPVAIILGLFFLTLYFYLCFGTGQQCRNIEIRYFLQADILLLIPAAYLINRVSFINSFIQKKLI